jgi:hypothetical protein
MLLDETLFWGFRWNVVRQNDIRRMDVEPDFYNCRRFITWKKWGLEIDFRYGLRYIFRSLFCFWETPCRKFYYQLHGAKPYLRPNAFRVKHIGNKLAFFGLLRRSILRPFFPSKIPLQAKKMVFYMHGMYGSLWSFIWNSFNRT